MREIICEQRSEEWFKARLGIPSASNFDKIITSEGKRSRTRDKYLYKLAGERITQVGEEGYTNGAMERGILMEPEAIELYSFVSGNEVRECGFFIEDTCGAGASPDGIIDEDGLLEIKCPNLATHVGYLLLNGIPTEYFQQTQGQLLITGRKHVDFFSYYPGIKPLLVRAQRDEPFLAALEKELVQFSADLEDVVKRIS